MQKILNYLCFFTFLIIVISCKREETEIGLEIQSPSDSLELSVYNYTNFGAYSIADDSLYTSYIGKVLGCYQDAVFGKTKANIYTQVTLRESSIDLTPFASRFDSIKLDLQISDLYPSAKEHYPLKIFLQVYQLSEELPIEGDYYAGSSVKHESDPLFEGEAVLSFDSVEVDGKMKSPHISVRLKDAFMDNLKVKFSDNASFTKKIKGLCLEASSEHLERGGALVYVNLSDSSLTGLKLYYRNDENAAKTQVFSLGNGSFKFSQFQHDYSGTALSPLMNNPKDSLPSSQGLYIQNLGGTVIRLRLNDLKKWSAENPKAVINNAVLILPVITDEVKSDFPAQLICGSYNAEGQVVTIPDLSNLNSFGGKYDASKKQYTLRITRYIQNVLNGKLSHRGLVIFGGDITGRRGTASRCVIDGSKIVLQIQYSE